MFNPLAVFTNGKPQYVPLSRLDAQIAQVIAKERSLRMNRFRAPENDLGGSANLDADTWGLRGELAAIHFVESRGIQAEYRLLEDRPVSQADLMINGLRFEVKAVRPFKKSIAINARQHKEKRCDFYIPIVFVSETQAYVYPPIPHAAFSSCIMQMGISPYMSAQVDDLLRMSRYEGGQAS